MRTALVTAVMVVVIGAVLFLMVVHPEQAGTELEAYYLDNFEADTGAGNAVAAIYLNYRLYDTFFEALLLLIAIVGIMHFFRIGRK